VPPEDRQSEGAYPEKDWSHWGSSRPPNFVEKDPPPMYDGKDPNDTYPMLRRELMLWFTNTDTPSHKRGNRIFQRFSGDAKKVVARLTNEELTSDRAEILIIQKLDQAYDFVIDVELPKHFNIAVYDGKKHNNESYVGFVARKEAEFTDLATRGCDLPPIAQAVILKRHADLQEREEERIDHWTDGKYELHSLRAAIRRLDKGKPKKHHNYFGDDFGFGQRRHGDDGGPDRMLLCRHG
jgi:hypothetical protein